jgi:hypothetical protein
MNNFGKVYNAFEVQKLCLSKTNRNKTEMVSSPRAQLHHQYILLNVWMAIWGGKGSCLIIIYILLKIKIKMVLFCY